MNGQDCAQAREGAPASKECASWRFGRDGAAGSRSSQAERVPEVTVAVKALTDLTVEALRAV